MLLTFVNYTLTNSWKYCRIFLLFFSVFSLSSVTGQVSVSFNSDKEGGCPPFSVQFNSNISSATENAQYHWDFGNGNSSDLKNPASVYTEEKTYKVTLTVTDAGKSYSYSREITGYKKPVADFSVLESKACIPAVIHFKSNSTPGSGSLEKFYWDYGDGATQQEYSENASHTYMMLMKPSATLTVTNSYGCYSSVTKKEIAEILPTISSSFAASRQVLCKPTDAVQFTNNSSGPGTLSYTWDFGDGHTSTEKAPSYAFNKKGIYTVSLTVKNDAGCSITSTQADYLNVASYKSAFNAPSLICRDQTVSFVSTSTPAPSTTTWFLDDQEVYYWYYNYNGLSYPFGDTLEHTIKLVNTFGSCPDTASAKIRVRPMPLLNGFVADLQNPCGAPATVKFKDTTAGAVQWNWKFYKDYNNVSTATVQAPSYTFTNDGNYSVSLEVSNMYGCTAGAMQNITITRPFANIYNTIYDAGASYCGYLKASMAVSYSSDEIRDYKWVFSDGATSTEKAPVHEFTKPGNYSVYLEFTTSKGCKGTSNSVSFTVYKKPKADFISLQGTNICGNTPVTFSYTGGTATSYLSWLYEGDYNYVYNNSQTVQYNAAGSYGVTLIAYNGDCSDTINKPGYITVVPPFPKIAPVKPSCEGTRGVMEFTQSSIGAQSWKWDWGDGKSQTYSTDEPTVKHEYTATGSYKVVLTTTNGTCSRRDSLIVPVLLKQHPVLSFQKNSVCGNESIPFSITGVEKNPYSGAIYNGYNLYGWGYEDGSPFNGNWQFNYNTTFITSASGTLYPYEVKNGKMRVILKSVVAECFDTSNYVPIQLKGAAAAFTVEKDKQCLENAVVLKDASTANNNTITSWTWNFGDGQTQTVRQGGTISHVYSDPGSYNVTLAITDAGGCSSSTPSYSKYVEVYGPKAAFGLSGTNVPLNSTIIFYNYTNTYGSDHTQYKWDFGDGTFGDQYYAQHTYPQAGVYTVKLTATDPVTGCSSEAAPQTITVRYFNTAFQFSTSFVTGTDCAPVVANFANTSYGYTKIIWDFGDGATLQDVNYPSHVYKDAGIYIVTLFVYGYNGLTGEYRDTVTITQPSAALKSSPAELCIGQPANLKASGDSISRYIWDFGDGNIITSSDSTTTHTYTGSGTFAPQLLVTGSKGCTRAASAGGMLTIRPDPVVVITPVEPRICYGESVQLKASGGVSYSWTAADGISDLHTSSPVIKPGVTTTYTVQVKDDLGCASSRSHTVTVVQKEELAEMKGTEICYGEPVQLSASGTSTYQWIKETNWLSDTKVHNPVAKPERSIHYTVVGGDIYGCFTDTAAMAITVHPLPTVNAGNDLQMQAGESLQISATGSPDVAGWQWLPDTRLSCNDCPTPVAGPFASTVYTVKVNTIYGCTASDDIAVKVLCEENTVYIPNAFTPDGDGKNDKFVIYGIGVIKHLVIFDRYGKKVYERNNLIGRDTSTAWDGTLNGQPLPTGTFVYYAEMECSSGGPFMRKGTITLIR